MNPYASFLGGQNPAEVIAATPARLRNLAQSLGPDGLNRSTAPGKWTAREILCHLADCEVAFAFRLRQALAEPNHVIQPFDQDKWAATYAGYDGNAALYVFAALRGWNVELISNVPADALAKPVTHPERGTMTIQTIVETMGGHDINHIQQIESIARQ